MDQEKFGMLIKEIRQKNQLTQKEFADRYGVTYQAVSKWENGRNLPDITLIKQIAKDFDYRIDDLIDGKKTTRGFKKYIWIIITLVIVIFILLAFIFKPKNSDFSFKKLSTTCSNFTLSGNIAYNKKKTAIYISNIDYCGNQDNSVYSKIECTLYEDTGKIIKEISSCDYQDNKNISLENFLKNVTISIDNYATTCREYNQNSLYLEIDATKDNDHVTYKVPLSMEDSCEK